MNKYEIEDVISGDSSRDEKQIEIKCVGCDTSQNEDKDEFSYVCDDVYCQQCLFDADLIAWSY